MNGKGLSAADRLVERRILELDVDVMVHGIARLERDGDARHQAQHVGLEDASFWSNSTVFAVSRFLGVFVDGGGLGQIDEHDLDPLAGGVDDQALGHDRLIDGADFGVLRRLALLLEDLDGRGSLRRRRPGP